MNTKQKVNQHTKKSATMGALSKLLAIMLALNMAFMLALPIGIFADDIVINGGEIEAVYGDPGGQATTPSPAEAEIGQPTPTPAEGGVIDIGTPNTPTAEPAPDPGEGISFTPLAINGDTWEVFNWADFKQAITDANAGKVSKIKLMNNIERSSDTAVGNDLPVITRSLEIDGSGFTLNAQAPGVSTAINRNTFKLGGSLTAAGSYTITLKNIVINRQNATTRSLIGYSTGTAGTATGNSSLLNSRSWTVNLQGFKSLSGVTQPAPILSISDGVLNITGENSWTQNCATPTEEDYTAIRARVLYVQGGNTKIVSNSRIFVSIPNANDTANPGELTVNGGGKLWMESTGTAAYIQAVRLGADGRDNSATGQPVRVKIDGAGSSLEVFSSSYGQGDLGAALTIVGGSGGYEIINGGYMHVYSKGHNVSKDADINNDGMPAVIQQIKGGKMYIGPGSEMFVESEGNSIDYGAALRLRDEGNQLLEIDGGKLTVKKYHGYAGGFRMGWGENNTFWVHNGGIVDIWNHGTGVNPTPTNPNNGAQDYQNMGFHFATPGWTFTLEGQGSTVQVVCDSGPALSAYETAHKGTINIGPGTVFVARGRTATQGGGAFTANGNNIHITADNPLFYDFANTRVGGGLVIKNGSSSNNSYFDSKNSDISFWRTGQDAWDGNPADGLRYTRINFRAQGVNMGSWVTSPPSIASGGFTPYTRIAGNNAPPKVKEALNLTNADKHVRFIGTVPEGLTLAPRPVQTDEVFGRFQQTRGSDVTEHAFASLLNRDPIVDAYYEQEKVSTPREGILKYSPGGFLIPGDIWEIKSAWRGPSDTPGAANNHNAVPGVDLTAPAQTVQDVLPPDPVTISGHSTGEIWTDERVISGTYPDMTAVAHNNDPVASIYAIIDGAGTKYPAVLGANNSWTVTLPESLNLSTGQKVYIVAADANGNENPLVDTKLRDTVKLAAPYLTVKEFPLELKSVAASIGLKDARDIQNAADEYAALKNLIQAESVVRNGMQNPYPNLNVAVTGDGGFAAEIFALPYNGGQPKDFSIPFESIHHSPPTANGTVTVFPFEDWNGGIGANPFSISAENAAALLGKSVADRDIELKSRSGASANENYNNNLGTGYGVLGSEYAEVDSLDLVAIPGYPGKVTFRMKNAPTIKVTVDITVIQGNVPVLSVSSPIKIWAGPLADQPAGTILPSEYSPMMGVSAFDHAGVGAVDITSSVVVNGTVDFNKIDEPQTIGYSVTNADTNTVTANRIVVVFKKGIPIDGYFIIANSLVATTKEISDAGSTGLNSFIVNRSYVKAWLIESDVPAEIPLLPIATTGVVREFDGLSPTPRDYNTVIGANQVGSHPVTNVVIPVTTRVVQKDVLAQGSAAYDTKYAVVANNVARTVSGASGHSGLGDAAKQWLIAQAAAVGYSLPQSPPAFIGSHDVDVIKNDLPATPVSGQSYKVQFIPKGIGEFATGYPVICEVTFTVSGTAPVIAFDADSASGANDGGNPLVIAQTPGQSHMLTAAEIKAKMKIIDPDENEASLLTATEFRVGNGSWITNNGVSSIDTQNAGVYKVEYRVTDSDGLSDQKARAIVVTDGRYEINKVDNLIIGAKNFVKLSSSVAGTQSEVRDASNAVAYQLDGTPISANELIISNWATAGYGPGAAAKTYDFSWKVNGYPNAVKQIKGFVVDGEYIFPGGPNDQYALVASKFTKTISEAEAMLIGTKADNEIAAAKAVVYKLVDGISEGRPYIITDDGFPGNPTTAKTYKITIGIQKQSGMGWSNVVTSPPSLVVADGIVTKGGMPSISVTTPLSIPVGGTFNSKAGVALIDDEDPLLTGDAATLDTLGKPVDTNQPGLYPMVYSYTDPDGNPLSNPLDGQRVVVVNDGHYTVSDSSYSTDGMILYAHSFVILASAVETGATQKANQIKALSGAKFYDGRTAAEQTTSLVNIGNNSYGPTAGDYDIALSATDRPAASGTLTKNIKAVVVDAEIIDPEVPEPYGDTTHIHGRNRVMTVSEAVAVATAESAAAAGGLKDALAAGAILNAADGSISHLNISIADTNSFVTKMLGSGQKTGTFSFTVSDTPAAANSHVFTIQVSAGTMPQLTVTPKPLNIEMPVAAGDKSGNSISADKIKQGVVATDEEAIAGNNPSGDISASVTYVIEDAQGNTVNSIPADVAAFYKVTYTVIDSDGNDVSSSRAVLVNDGRFIYNTEYVLTALSFIINKSQVNVVNATNQLLQMTEAKAWRIDGSPAIVTIGSNTYTNQVNLVGFQIPINVGSWGKQVYARVIEDAHLATAPGTSIEDGNSDNGKRYAIFAHNFRVNTVDAKTLKDQQGTQAFATAVLDRAGVVGYDRTNDNFGSGGTRTYVSDTISSLAAQPAEGDSFQITFKVSEDSEAVVTIKAFVSNAQPPAIHLPATRVVWTGDPLSPKRPAGSFTPSEFNYINSPQTRSVYATDDYDNDDVINAALKIGKMDGSNFVETATPIDFVNAKAGFYKVTYRVTDSDHNTTTVTEEIGVNMYVDGDYGIAALDFVTSKDEVAGSAKSVDAQIIDYSYAKAWRIDKSGASVQLIPVDPVIKNNGGFNANVANYPVDYPNIVIGVSPVAPYQGDPKAPINGKVVDKNKIARGPDGAASAEVQKYVIAGNNISLLPNEAMAYRGTGDTAKANIITATASVGHVITAATGTTGGAGIANVGVLSNTLSATTTPTPNTDYKVVLYPLGVPGAPANPAVQIELTIHVTGGNDPVIEFTRIPLVVQQSTTSQTMSDLELKQYVNVTDVEDAVSGYQTQLTATPLDGNGQVLQGGINKSQIGIYKVKYVATDQQGNSSEGYRAVVVTDGRYIITDNNQDGKLDQGHIILGARNFVVMAAAAETSTGALIGLSYAEAYDGAGTDLSNQLALRDQIPAGYLAKTPNEYPFTWHVPSYQTTKGIKGTIVNATDVDQGDKNSQYAIVASDFSVNTTDAQAIITGGEPSFISAANVRVFPLVEGASAKQPKLESQGQFAATPSNPYYTITYRIDGIPATTQRVVSNATVSDGTPPNLQVPTPLVVWVGNPSSSKRPAGSILPAEYQAKYSVTVTDIEDAAKGQDLTLNDVSVSYPSTAVPSVFDDSTLGNYQVRFEVTDSDHNSVIRDRVVTVDNGDVTFGVLRSLRARPFVIRSADVTTNTSLIDNQLLLQTKATLFDNVTNQGYPNDLFIPAGGRGNFSPTPAIYNIIVGGHDGGSNPDLSKNVKAEVVNVEVLEVSPDSPTLPNYYIFGNNIQLTPVEAQAIVDSANKSDALVAALGAGARKTDAESGSLPELGVVVDNHSNFLDRSFYSAGQPVIASMGTYNVTIKDAENKVSAQLTVYVGTGQAPYIVFNPDPLVLNIASTPGNLTTAQLMEGVTGRDADDEAASISVNVTVSGSPAIPGDVAGVTPVTYSVTDSAGNTVSDVRAVVVNDGSIVIGTNYILRAHSFQINKDDVDTTNRDGQIKTLSQARGWTKKGADVQIARVAIGPGHGYTNSVGDWPVSIYMQDEPSVARTITAKVVNDKEIDNGERYSIAGNPFRLNYQDANAAKLLSSAQLAALFIGKADVKSYLRAGNMSNQAGTKLMVNDGGFAAYPPFSDTLDEGRQFDVTFQVAEDPTAEVTVKLTISRGTPPTLTIDPVQISSPLAAPLTDSFLRNGVTANDNEDHNITDRVTYDASTVNINVKGFYPVSYSVTDSDYNTVTAKRIVAIGIIPNGNYAVDAYDFVVSKQEVVAAGANTDALIKTASFAQAWKTDWSDPNNIVISNVDPAVKSSAGFSANAASYPVTYQPIVIGVNPVAPFTGNPLVNISGKVVDKDIIDRGPDDGSSNDKYTVAANPIVLFPAEAEAYRGTNDSAKGNIIQAMGAEGYKASSDTSGVTTVGGLGINYVDVLSNELAAGATPEPGRTYKVVLYPKGVPGAPSNPVVKIEVNMTISNGHSPTIDFARNPLVLPQAAASQIMTDLELKANVNVSDIEDIATGYSTVLEAQVIGENGQPLLGGIDKSKIGVYKVRYTATDRHSNKTIKERAVIINDGRYVIPDTDNDGKIDAGQVIIGARNFVVKAEDVDPNINSIRSLSYAEAFDAEGTSLNSLLYLPDGIPSGYNSNITNEDSFTFRWQVTGYPTAKQILATVVVATVVDSGGKNSQYSIAASDFTVNTVDALAIVTAGEPAYISAANVRVFRLVSDSSVAEKQPKLVTSGGFSDVVLPAGYDITFQIEGIPATTQKAIIKGRVTNMTPPDLQVQTPLVVWVGDPSDPGRTAGSILPAAYEAKYGVTVSDVEDTAKGQPLTLSAVTVSYPGAAVPAVLNADAVGNYPIHFEVTDSDYNSVEKDRVLIVNDGRITLGSERSLRANGFVIKAEDVATSAALIDIQLLNQTEALLFDNTTNASYPNDRFIQNRDGYSPTPRVYNIVVGGHDGQGKPDILRTVQAEVVDADVIEIGPDDPNKPKYNIYGNNIVLTPVDAQAIVDAADKNAALINALGSYARLSQPSGTLTPVDVVIDNHSNFLNRSFYSGGAAVAGSMGEYGITVKDSGNHISAALKVTVGVGSVPRINFNPDPLELGIASVAGNLSTAQLMQGVTATDQEDNAAGLTLTPTVVGNPAIPGDVAGVTTVTYTVTDSAGNVVTAERAVVINDGSITIGTNYILRAHSFIIHVNNVDVANRESQIKTMSHARGWTKKGTEIAQARVSVNSHGGYTATVNDYNVTIGMLDEPSLTRSINAKVVGDDIVVNGDRYSITGNHFRLNYQDANAAKAMSYNDRTAMFVSRAGVKSYLRAGTMGSQSGNIVMTSDGGFGSSAAFTDADEGRVFQVTFWVDEDHTATETVNCTISRGTMPVLTVPGMKVSSLGTPITEAFYRQGVVAYDTEDISLTAKVSYDATAVNINVIGFYDVTYSVTDSDHNTVTAIGVIYVGDGDIDRDYMTAGRNFVTTADAITAAADKNQLILDLSHAGAWRITRATPDEVLPVPVQPVVKADGNLTAVAGNYTGIQIGVNPVAPYEGNPRTTVNAKVLDRDIISNKPDVDDGTEITPPDGNDQNIDNPDDQNRYVVAADYGSIRLSEVNDFVGLGALAKSRLINRASAESYRITESANGSTIDTWAVDVINNPIPANAAAGNSYWVTFIAQGVQSVWIKAKFTVSLGNDPVINIDGPLVKIATETPTPLYRNDLMQGVTASDVENGPLTSLVEVLEPGTDHMPNIDLSKPGIYPVAYTVSDNDGNTATAERSVIINDGRYDLIDEDGDNKIDIIIGAKNFALRQADAFGTLAEAKNLSYIEAYDTRGQNLSGLAVLGHALPSGYAAKDVGVYDFNWQLQGHSNLVSKAVKGEILSNDYIVDPGDKTSSYALAAKNFSVNTTVAATITSEPTYVSAASARVIKLVNNAPNKNPVLFNNGGFQAVQGVYSVIFGAAGIGQGTLSLTVVGTVTNGQPPVISCDTPIYFPLGAPGSPAIGASAIMTGGHVTAYDTEDRDLTPYVQVLDAKTNAAPYFQADAKGVYQVRLKVTDSDHNAVEKVVAVSVGVQVFGDFLIEADDFSIDLRDVTVSRTIQQILEQSGARAWNLEGTPLQVSVSSTGGYRDAAGVYHPVVAVYDSVGGVTSSVQIQLPITATVLDTFTRYRVTFDGNGGTLIGPRSILVVEPATTLPYMPASPIRDGYNFRYWATSPSGGTQFTSDTALAGDVTVYAQWQLIPVPPTPQPTPPPNIIVNPPAAGNSTTYVTVPPDNIEVSVPPSQSPTVPTPEPVKVEPAPSPTTNAPEPTWSLFDLLATIIALLLLIAFVIKYFFDRPRDEEYEEEPIDAQLWAAMTPDQRAQYQERREADYQAWLNDQQRRSSMRKAMFVNAPVLLIVAAALVEAVIVLGMTQDFGATMKPVDDLSVIFAAVIFVQLLTPMVAAVIHNNRRIAQQSSRPAQPPLTPAMAQPININRDVTL